MPKPTRPTSRQTGDSSHAMLCLSQPLSTGLEPTVLGSDCLAVPFCGGVLRQYGGDEDGGRGEEVLSKFHSLPDVA